ncbi:hypothetical protein ACG83_25970 [Frankia sp. R43]|uniref:tyrosine-type recombinase/integrase n=1 Tax=Frankia sp. R43 TaxID=269536 RepID=UPI0006CA4C8C|nr:site-specific integrase [Frankia sp. R43]KPM52883.1 hypothetical protein ACG83_25970 [Frankia sp. R43]
MPKRSNTRQLPSGRWQGRYVGPDGKRHQKTFDTDAEASAWVKTEQVAANEGDWVSPISGKAMFGPWAEGWLTTRVNVRASTMARDESVIRCYVLPSFEEREVSSIEEAEVREWVTSLVKSGKSAATTIKAYQLLANIMSAAVDAKLIRRSPCYNVPLPKIEHQEQRFLTVSEVHRLAEAVPARYRALVLVCCYGGLRIGEAAGLDRRHVEGDKLKISQGAVEVRGVLTVGPLKTRKARRTVSLPPAVAEVLRAHMDEYVETEPDAPVFPTPWNTRLRPNGFRSRVWAKAVKDAGLARLRVHDMRHTAVAIWISTGAPVLLVSRRAGHASVSFTLDRYGHLYEEADDALVAGLSAAYERATPAVPASPTTEARPAAEAGSEPSSGAGLAPVIPLKRAS